MFLGDKWKIEKEKKMNKEEKEKQKIISAIASTPWYSICLFFSPKTKFLFVMLEWIKDYLSKNIYKKTKNEIKEYFLEWILD